MRESNVHGGRFDGRDYKVSVTIVFWYFCLNLLNRKQTILKLLPSRLNAPSLTSLRKPIYIFGGERNFNPTGKPNNWRKNSFDAHENTGVPVLTTVPLSRQVKFCVQWKVSRKDANACCTNSFASWVLRMEAGMKNSPKRNVSCAKKRAQNTQKEHAKILRNKANGFMKVRLSLRLLSLRSNRFRLLVAKRKKRGKRVKVLIVQLCLGVVPRCAALAMATSLFVIVQLFIRALDGL